MITKLGKLPSKQELQNFRDTFNFNFKKNIFENRNADAIREMRKRAFKLSVFRAYFKRSKNRFPKHKLPTQELEWQKFSKQQMQAKFVWLGHSGFLFSVNAKNFLIDPVFGPSASPFKFMVYRFQEAVCKLQDLPEIDYYILTHDHYDHLDWHSVQFFKNKKCKFLCPIGVGAHLRYWGIEADRIVELAWGQTHQYDDLEFVCTPSQHFSGRNLIGHNKSLWCSWVLKTPVQKFFFSGDSGYDIHFQEIGDTHGPFDLAFIECGQYNELWKEVHMLPDHSIQAFVDLKAKQMFPIHWGMFVLSLHAWNEPIQYIAEKAKDLGFKFVAPKMGEILDSSQEYKNEEWWK